ncbi:MAG: SPOR domain-containing protein [Betaproteobacteria bacterium]
MAEPANSALDDARKRARRRLVGAVVLALVAAVVVPMFLESDPKPLGPDVQIQIPAVDDAKFQNRLTPPDKTAAPDKAAAQAKGADQDKPTPTPPVAGNALPKATDSAVPPKPAARSDDPVADAGKQEPAAITQPTPAPAADHPTKAAPAPAADHPTKAATPPKPAEKKAVPAKKPAPEPVPSSNLGTATLNTAPPATAKTGEFVVQLGAFADRTVATDLAAKAGEQGYAVYLEPVTTKAGTIQRVRVGPFPSRSAADAAASKLGAAGFTAIARPR